MQIGLAMRKYGRAAVLATKLITEGFARDPLEAWRKATVEIFPDSPSSQEKGCPKGAYLGLCEEGLVQGVRPGEYTTSKENKGYALKAVELLGMNPSLAKDEDLLWSKVLQGENKTPNSQMDVVISLWTLGLINTAAQESLDDLSQQKAVLRYSMKEASKIARENPY
jgi:hypothetical protein